MHQVSVLLMRIVYEPANTIRYIPDGNSKFGAVEITSPPTADQSLLRYRLFVDGEEKWSYTITTPPDIRGGGRAKDAVWG